MSDFFDGDTIHFSVHDPDAIAKGWIQINGVLAKPTPDCDYIYWKIEDGKIVEMTQAEKDVVDNPVVIKTADDYFNLIMAWLSPQESVDFLDVYDEFPSFSLLLRHGDVDGAKSRIDTAEQAGMLTEEQADKIKTLMDS